MPKYTLPQRNNDSDDSGGFLVRDLIRFFIVDIILIVAIKTLLGLGFFPSVDHYVLAILASKVILFLYLLWLIRDRRDASWDETGATRIGPWWGWPVGLAIYAAGFALIPIVDRFNKTLMEHLHAAVGWVYTPQPQDVMILIFEDILQNPVRVVLIFFIVVAGPFMEELAFRGVGIDAYRRSSGVFAALLLTSVLFGLFHFNLGLLLPLSFLGLVFGVIRVVSRNLWCPICIHALHNSVALLAMAHELGFLETFKNGWPR